MNESELRCRQPMMPADHSAVDWAWVKAETLDAVDGLIDRRLQAVTLVQATGRPVPFKGHWRQLTVRAKGRPPAGGWERQRWFVVDADTVGSAAPRRAQVVLKEPPRGSTLIFDLTGAGTALADVPYVHGCYSNDLDLQLLMELREALDNCTRGPQLLDLWSQRPMATGGCGNDSLNHAQQQALAAMTHPGGAFVWGPPGTGKTKVIVSAVNEARRRGRSVLIASHTHVAVDNVVLDVAGAVDEPGQLVRVGSTKKIADRVVDHDWLTLDKAAAALTNHAERLAAIDAAAAALVDHPARTSLDQVSDRIDDADVDADAAILARDLSADIERLTAGGRELDHQHASISAQLHEAQTAYTALGDTADAQRRAVQRLRAAGAAAEVAGQLVARLENADLNLAAAQSDAVAARVAAESRVTGLFGRRRAQQRIHTARTNEAIVSNHRLELAPQLAAARATARTAGSELAAAQSAAAAADGAAARAAEHAAAVARLRDADAAAAAAIEENTAAIAAAEQQLVSTAPDHRSVLEIATAAKLFDLIDEYDRLTGIVADLDQRALEVDRARSRLGDEYRATRSELLDTAPIIACTLSALASAPELVRRRFDVVIIDEAASADIPRLVYAGAKADRTLVYVGDFLQNEPIVDTADATTDRERRRRRWQRDDIFGLLGIHDRATAEAEPRCVALRTQYRYPPVIAGIVNDFCYDGLLESAWPGTPEPPHVIFIDTAGHPQEGLRRSGTSWTHPLGLQLLRAVVNEYDGAPGTFGMVCPYSPHAAAATRLAQEEDLPIECGTSHRFQGRQFPVVVFDLMQDSGRDRWVAAADLAGGSRQVSAAKLLNVGITRAQQTLYLIGDWNYIHTLPAPGMRALRKLQTHPHFRRVSAAELLTGRPRKEPARNPAAAGPGGIDDLP